MSKNLKRVLAFALSVVLICGSIYFGRSWADSVENAIQFTFIDENEKPISGLNVELYKPDTTTEQAQKVSVATTNSSGVATFVNLDGVYILSPDTTKYSIDMSLNKNKTQSNYDSIKGFMVFVTNGQYTDKGGNSAFVLTKKLASLTVNKTSSLTNDEKTQPLKGAQFVLQDADGDDVTEVLTTDDSGKVVFTNLEPGSYKLVEKQAPEGYVKSDAKDIVVQLDKINEITVENLAYKAWKIKKVDSENNKPLEGVEFALYLGNELVETKTTDANGEIIFRNLYKHDNANYHVVETKALPGYVKITEINNEFEGTKNVALTVPNTKAKLIIRKVKEDKTPLAGAKISVYLSDKNSSEIELVHSFTSTEEDYDITPFVEYGNYYLIKETSAPEDYKLSEKPVLVPWFVEGEEEINSNVIVEIENAKEKPKYRVDIKKVDESDKILSGAHLSICFVTEDGKIGDVVGNYKDLISSKDLFVEIENGKYAVIETLVPEGYVKSEPVFFEVKDAQTEVKVTDQETSIQIEKKASDTNKVLSGATLQIINESGKVVKTVTTTEDILTVKKLPVGKYTLHESKAPTGYQLANDVEFEISDNVAHNNDLVTMVDQPEGENIVAKNLLKISKQDKETKEILHGSVITIYKYHNILYKDIQYQTVTLPGSYSADFDITAFEPADWYIPGDTGTVESIATFEIEDDIDIYDVPDLENGKYVIVEESAPLGYYLDSEPVVVVFDKNVSQLEKVSFENTPTKVEISKIDSKTKQPIEGAMLELYDGDKLIDSWKSTTDAYLIKALEIGKEYTLHETKAPDGYTLGSDITFTVKDLFDEDEWTQKVSFENNQKPATYAINILKVDENSKALVGATLALYQKSDIQPNKLIKTWTSTKDVYRVDNLDAGTYILKETSAPAGFVPMVDTEFTITDNGQLLSKGNIVNATNRQFNLNVVNSKTKVLIKKLVEEEKGKTYAIGAVLKIVDENEKEIETYTVTEENPIIAISGLEVGKNYKVIEVDAPGRYTIADPVPFTVKNTKDEQSIIMMDHLRDVKYNVLIDKKDEDGNFIKGAKLRLSKITENGNEEIETWTTKKDVKTITKLAPGEYIIEEIETPAGYRTINPVKFTLKVDQERKTPGVDDFITDKEIHLVDKYTVVKINKIDSMTGGQIAGAEFDIYDYEEFKNLPAASTIGDTTEHDTVIEVDSSVKPVYSFTSTEDKEVIKNVLTTDKCYVLVESKAPKGYKYANPVAFTVDNDEKEIEVTVIDNKKEIPSYRVEIIKMGKGKLALEGATLKLFKIVNNKEVTVEDEWITERTGRFFTLQPGEYIIKELKAPDGYLYTGNADYAVNFTIGDGEDTFDSDNVNTTQEGKSVTITDKETQVIIKKIDTDGKLLAGAELELYDGETKIDEWTSSDVSAHVITGKLVAGKKYTLVEAKAPAGYDIAKSKDFIVPKYDETYEVLFLNKKTQIKTYDITIGKQDITTNVEISGATLKLEKITENGVITQDDWTWVSEGTAHTISGLTAGSYKLIETLPPASKGYVKAPNIDFTLNEDGSSPNKIVMHDDYTKLNIEKIDNNGEYVEGAILELLDENGKVYKTWTSKKGAEEIRYIPAGKYTLTETKAPDGYEIAKPMEIIVLPIGRVQTYQMVDNKTTITHTVNISKKEISKTDELRGAKLTVTYKTGSNTKVLDSWTSTSKTHKLSNVLEGVVYTLTETKAPDGFLKAEDIAFFVKTENNKSNIYVGKTTDNKEDFTLVGDTSNSAVTMFDDYTKVEVRKLEGKGKLLAGAKLEIKDESGKVVARFTSKSDKGQLIYKLKPGKYTLTETSAPTEYAIAEPVDFEIKETSELQVVTMTDVLKTKTTTYDLKISKQDITNKKELPGAVLVIKDKDGKEIARWTSTNSPHVINALPFGEYTLTELSAPSGYTKAEVVSFILDKDGKSQDTITMKDDVTKVKITKKDSSTKNALAGAKLELIDEDGDVIESWVSTTSAKTFTKLAHGKYTLREVEAPAGYELASDVTFEVTDKKETVIVEMFDEKVALIQPKTKNAPTQEQLEINETVQTSDDNNIVLLITLFLVILMAIPTTVILYKKRK